MNGQSSHEELRERDASIVATIPRVSARDSERCGRRQRMNQLIRWLPCYLRRALRRRTLGMTDRQVAKKEIYQRKVAVCERVAEANGAATGDYGISPGECSDALIAAGLPAIQSWTEWFSILYGPQPADPGARELKRLAREELMDIAFAAMDGNKKITAEDALAARGVTWVEAEALATKRARDKLGMRQN